MPEHTIAENLTRLQNAKTAIGNAITNAGGTVSQGDGLEEFATDVGTIVPPINTVVEAANTSLETSLSSGGSPITLIEKTVTSNATYNASDDNADGYSKVVVNVPQGGNAKFIYVSSEFSITSLESIEIPDGVTTISNSSFSSSLSWVSLKKIVIPSSVTSIISIVFNYRMPNLEEIIIHKPQDSISGAPWGATNATVIWDG